MSVAMEQEEVEYIEMIKPLLREGERVELVPTFKHIWATNLGRIFSTRRGAPYEMSQSDSGEYKQVGVLSAGGVTVHTLVLAAFCGKRKPNQVCRHLNGNGADNRLSNLSYGTQGDNYRDSVRHGTAYLGTQRFFDDSPLDEEAVLDIRNRAALEGESYESIGNSYGVTGQAIRKVARGQTWQHVGGPIDSPRSATERDVDGMIRMRQAGHTLKEIGNRYGKHLSTISRIMKKHNVKKGQ